MNEQDSRPAPQEPGERPAPPETPTLDRLAEARPQWDIIQEWMEWLAERGYRLGGFQYHRSACGRHDHGDKGDRCICEEVLAECYGVNQEQCPYRDRHVDWLWWMPMRDRSAPLDRLLEQYSGIGPREVEPECRSLLEHIRELNRREAGKEG